MFPIINLGPLSIPAPGLILLLGFWLGSVLAERKSKRFKVNPNLVEKVLWACLLAGLIGARLSYIARYPSAFQENLLSIFSLNPNLLDPFGGLLISAAVGFVYISHQQFSLWSLLDSLTPFFAVMVIALSFSNFAAGTGFGTSTTLPWGISLWGELRHPVQIYHLAGGFVVLYIISIRKQTNEHLFGFTFLLFVSLTSGFRLFFIGFQETASLVSNGIRLPQLTYWTILAISLFLFNKHYPPPQMEKPDEPQR
jgi:phosphatidylglycerol:prolipoprotein diacylglycerol transferase